VAADVAWAGLALGIGLCGWYLLVFGPCGGLKSLYSLVTLTARISDEGH